MSDLKEQTLKTPTEVIALPPLRMILVHAVNTRRNAELLSGNRDEQVDSRAVKKLIAHLENKEGDDQV
jgi:hypothetical protein